MSEKNNSKKLADPEIMRTPDLDYPSLGAHKIPLAIPALQPFKLYIINGLRIDQEFGSGLEPLFKMTISD